MAAYERMVAGGEPVDLDAETLTDIAEHYAMRLQDEEADRCIRYALSFYPDSTDPQIFLARKQMFYGHQKEAWRICNAIADQEDQEVMFLRAELKFRDTQREDSFEELLLEFERMHLAQDPDAPELLYDIICLFRDYELLDMAMISSRKLRMLYPDYIQVIPLMAELHNCKGEHEEAIKLIDKHIDKLAFHIDAWLQWGDACWALKRFDEALEATTYALAIDENNAEAFLMRANVLFDYHKFPEAHSCYERFLEQFPNDDKVLFMDAQCLIYMDAYPQAVSLLKQYVGIAAKATHGYAYSSLAYCYQQMENEKMFRHYLQLAERESLNDLSELFPDLYPPNTDE